ncbi:signal protein [Rhodococcus sp. ACPA4]|uniref:NO-binding membrane sensor protein with MHYT domain n=1 Tax=Nocardia globerula TaxID=1818 RepID=A0A652YTG0_NOCGL|nr:MULTISPECIES: MHYT domain-containing protein [Rhodococcus]NMD61116.1 signal protein [Nocardia globerula]KJF21244.1 MHYT domain (predicted integral membrane sensor domain) [Rhodococcus sp. AD45]PBC37687.1 signal protein [Rhodococcus sp. ACPA4]PSR38755.1 signal protein [Rhodococcus sp. AD45-ID]PVX67330.1 NO-binding membrane sensor protein with MHYT domain [Rhodococcus globerulus]
MSDEMHHFSMGIWLLGLAFAVAVSGSVIGLACTRHGAAATHPAARLRWLFMGALSIGGVGIWLMHFIAMLGFAVPGSPIRYSLTWTIISALMSVTAVFVGLLIVGTEFRWSRLLAAGFLVGIAVNIMHYTGMRALRFQGEINYNMYFVALSLVIAVVAGTAALWFTMVMESTVMRLIAGVIMGVAVVGMHYTGMAAVQVVHDTSAPAPVGLEVFAFLFPVFVIGLLAMAVPIVAVLTVPDREIARMDSAADDLAFEAREFATRD